MDWKLLVNLDDKIRQWIEYCRELYKQEGKDDPMRRAIPPSEINNDNNDDDGTILKSEVGKAIQSLRCGKSARVDNIQAEMLKAGGDHITTALTTICNRIWHTKTWPEQWTKSIVITIPKKGNVQLC